MATMIRIGILSVAAAVYMGWAFRGIEYEALEAAPALLGLFLAFLIPTLVATPVYKKLGERSDAQVTRFTLGCWMACAAAVVLVWLVAFGRDAAAAGYFRDNLIVGIIGLVVLVVVLNFALQPILQYFAPKRR